MTTYDYVYLLPANDCFSCKGHGCECCGNSGHGHLVVDEWYYDTSPKTNCGPYDTKAEAFVALNRHMGMESVDTLLYAGALRHLLEVEQLSKFFGI